MNGDLLSGKNPNSKLDDAKQAKPEVPKLEPQAVAKRDDDEDVKPYSVILSEAYNINREIIAALCRSILPKDHQNLPTMGLVLARCQSLGLNPMGGGFWVVEMKGKISIMLHYGTYAGIPIVKGKLRRDDFLTECVYEGEPFSYTNSTVTHEFKPELRHGIPFGAYCVIRAVDMKTPRVYFITNVDFAKSRDSESAWVKSAYEMTRKAALKVALKNTFPEEYAGVYTEGDFDAPTIDLTENEAGEFLDAATGGGDATNS